MARAPRPPRSRSRFAPRLPRRLGARAFGVVAALALVAALGGAVVALRLLPDGGEPSSSAAPRLVFTEFGTTADQIYVAPADDPTARTRVATAEHADGWGINASEVEASRIAYTALPAGTVPARDARAELWLLDLESGERTRLARDADLAVKPQFVDGGALIYRRSEGDRQAIVRVDIASQARTAVHEERTAFGILPLGYAGGALVFARISAAGSDVLRVRPGEEPALLLHASDELARDWRLSPDGRSLAFLAPEQRGERVVYRAQVATLEGDTARLTAGGDGTSATEQYGPTWTADGALTLGHEAASGAAPVTVQRAGVEATTLAAPARGFDVPVAWSRGGQYLAARTFDGANSSDPGREAAVVIAADGRRYAVAGEGNGEVTLVGWLSGA